MSTGLNNVVGSLRNVSPIFLPYSVDVDGFIYDDLVRIAKDYDVPLDLLKQFQSESMDASDFEFRLRPVINALT